MDAMGELLTHRTIRLALACIVGTFAIRIAQREHWGRDTPLSRVLWTLGCVFFVGHVLCAFQFFHHWSHAHAFRVTADRTREQLGFALGEGIYFSYLFTLLWIGEVVAMWARPAWYDARPRWLFWGVSVFMGFIAFNGAVVFEDGITRPLGVAATAGLSSLGFFAWREQQRLAASPADTPPPKPEEPDEANTKPSEPESSGAESSAARDAIASNNESAAPSDANLT